MRTAQWAADRLDEPVRIVPVGKSKVPVGKSKARKHRSRSNPVRPYFWHRVNPAGATEKDADKYRKVLALAERATGGERESAARRLVEMEGAHPGVTALVTREAAQIARSAPSAVLQLTGPAETKKASVVVADVARVGAKLAGQGIDVGMQAADAVLSGLGKLLSAGISLGGAALDARKAAKLEQKIERETTASMAPPVRKKRAPSKRKKGTRVTLPPGCKIVCEDA
jgi:hypothetical protein